MALRRAAKLLTKRSGLLLLLVQLSAKLGTVNWRAISIPSVKEKIFTFARLIKAYALGHYRDVSWKSMIIIVASVIYFVSPIDLIPDFIPLTGFSDDMGILLGAFSSVTKEVEKFLIWEKTAARLL